MGKDRKLLELEYEQLKEHRILLEEMLAEEEKKLNEMNHTAGAEHIRKRAESLRNALDLADEELLYLMKLIKKNHCIG